MRSALGVPGDHVVVEIKEFTEAQAQSYLRKKGVKADLPAWLPRKPLLLGYLAAHKLLEAVVGIEGERGLAYAWDQFLEKVCQREAEIGAEIDASTVRRILEVLANKTRESPEEAGPIYEADVSAAFRQVTGGEPLDAAMVLLQRLPGLTPRDQMVGVRAFIDREMVEMLRAGVVTRFIENPYSRVSQQTWYHPMSDFGCSAVAYLSENIGLPSTKFLVAAREASDRWNEPILSLDIILSGAARFPEDGIDCGGLRVIGGAADAIDLEEIVLKNLGLNSCFINVLRLPKGGVENLLLTGCLISRVDGASEMRGLPSWIEDATVDHFDSAGTNAAILSLNLPLATRVLLTIIRKLFIQRGKGLLESAFKKGLDANAQAYVDDILSILQAEKIAFSTPVASTRIWHGDRAQRDRALRILASPKSADDVVLRRVVVLG